MSTNEIKENKSSSEDSNKSDDSEEEKENENVKKKKELYSQSHKQMNKFISNKKLEKILEGDEENYLSNKETKDNLESIEDPQELITNLKAKIEKLQNQIIDLKEKNEVLKKDNFQNDKKLKQMSYVGVRKKFTFSSKGGTDNIKMAEMLREKTDLQEINEKMLNMLTDKEMELEEMEENFEKFKIDMKVEIKKYLETIDELEDKIESLEENNNNKQNVDNNLDEIIVEYNKYKERMDKSIKDHIKKEEELSSELESKEISIQNLKNEIQNLEIENIQLQNQTEQKEKDYDKELVNFDLMIHDNEKLKGEIIIWQQKLKKSEENAQKELESKEEEIKNINQDLEFSKKNLAKVKEEKNNEIFLLKNEISKYNRDINNLIKKNDILQKENEELVRNNDVLQGKFDKKAKELQDINESAKKLIENKDNSIKEYEDQIEEIRKEKNQLIEQNHELLDKLKNASTNNLADLLNEDEEKENNDNDDNENDNYENLLLKAEIKALKEQLENQASDLVSLNAMEKEVSRLKSENNKLVEDYKSLKERFNKQKYENGADELMESIRRRHNTVRNKKQKKFGNKNAPNLEENADINKQMEALKKIKDDEKKNLMDEIDKLKGDIAILKVKFLNQEFENETLLIKYKNYLKGIGQECKARGIRLNLNLSNL